MSEIALSRQSVPGLALRERLLSDERLAQRVAHGSDRAFTILCERHSTALHRYCRSILHDEDDAQDALQNALMHAFTALRASERDVAVRPWLFRIVHNEAISLVRRRQPESASIDVDEHVAALGGVAEAVEERERLATLVADIQTLTDRQRAALVMRELSGLSIEEIAAALSTSPGAAKQSLFEARCALQKLAEGRAMECDAVRRTISEHDGRMLRGRGLRAHLRACAGCREFGELIEARRTDLRALIPPLPAVAVSGLLARLLANGAGGGHAGGAATGAAASAASLGGQAAAVSLTTKALTGLVVGAVGLAAAVETAQVATRHPAQPPAHLVAHDAAHGAGATAPAGGIAAPVTANLVTRPGSSGEEPAAVEVAGGAGAPANLPAASNGSSVAAAERAGASGRAIDHSHAALGGPAAAQRRNAQHDPSSHGATRSRAGKRQSDHARADHGRSSPRRSQHPATPSSHPGKDSAPAPASPPADPSATAGARSGSGTDGTSTPQR